MVLEVLRRRGEGWGEESTLLPGGGGGGPPSAPSSLLPSAPEGAEREGASPRKQPPPPPLPLLLRGSQYKMGGAIALPPPRPPPTHCGPANQATNQPTNQPTTGRQPAARRIPPNHTTPHNLTEIPTQKKHAKRCRTTHPSPRGIHDEINCELPLKPSRPTHFLDVPIESGNALWHCTSMARKSYAEIQQGQRRT